MEFYIQKNLSVSWSNSAMEKEEDDFENMVLFIIKSTSVEFNGD